MIKSSVIFRSLVLAVCLWGCGFSLMGNDTIRFTWEDYGWNGVGIIAPNGTQFIVDWGDSSTFTIVTETEEILVVTQACIDTITGTGDWQGISHDYWNYGNNYTTSIVGITSDCLFTAFSCFACPLSSLEIIGCAALRELNCNNNQLTNLSLDGCSALQILNCSNNQLTNLSLDGCSALQILMCYNNQLTNLSLNGFVALGELDCSENKLTNLDLSTNMALQILWCFDNQLSSLNLNGCTALLELYCFSNQLVSLDLSTNVALLDLDCFNNQLKSLDVSKCLALQTLWGSDNQINSLDVSGCLALTALYCDNNQLIGFDVSKNTVLQRLDCYNNPLIVSKNTALQALRCSNNQLNSLDVSKNLALVTLQCSDNLLTSLDLSVNMDLKGLWCSNNQLNSLDLSKNTKLEALWCLDNQLTNLNLSKNTHVSELNCSNNQLKSLDLSKNESLIYFYCSNNQLNSIEVIATFWGLRDLECYDNRLHLSELYKISQILSSPHRISFIGTQTLIPQNIPVGKFVDFSAQKELNGSPTIFTVEKDGLPASASDYTINDGIITFYKRGIYTVTMTNDAIISHEDYPAQVIAEINVENVGIITIYPNPTTGELRVTSDKLPMEDIQIFDVLGRRLPFYQEKNAGEMKTDISHLAAGVYFLQVDGIIRKVIKN